MLAHAESLVTPDEKNSQREERLLAIGRTIEGRYTLVVFTPRPHAGEIRLRPISALHASEGDQEV